MDAWNETDTGLWYIEERWSSPGEMVMEQGWREEGGSASDGWVGEERATVH